MTTIVSAFISNMNRRKDRNIDNYLEAGITLLKVNIPKIVFVDEIIYEKIKDYKNDNTIILSYDIKSCYLYDYINDNLVNFNLNSTNKEKDTLSYVCIQCNKTEWVKIAIEMNYFKTTNFVWVDFGIKHVFKNNFIESIENLAYKNYGKIRMASIWNLDIDVNIDIYNDIAWYFAGGVFGGDNETLLKFAEKMKELCLKIIIERKTLMWEVNIWYLIYKENKEWFDCYYCDHNESILNNY